MHIQRPTRLLRGSAHETNSVSDPAGSFFRGIIQIRSYNHAPIVHMQRPTRLLRGSAHETEVIVIQIRIQPDHFLSGMIRIRSYNHAPIVHIQRPTRLLRGSAHETNSVSDPDGSFFQDLQL